MEGVGDGDSAIVVATIAVAAAADAFGDAAKSMAAAAWHAIILAAAVSALAIVAPLAVAEHLAARAA